MHGKNKITAIITTNNNHIAQHTKQLSRLALVTNGSNLDSHQLSCIIVLSSIVNLNTYIITIYFITNQRTAILIIIKTIYTNIFKKQLLG